MSSFRAKSQVARQQTQKIRALAAAADRAALTGDRETCTDLVAHIYQLLDSAHANTADPGANLWSFAHTSGIDLYQTHSPEAVAGINSEEL
jgi:hypothetical protein